MGGEFPQVDAGKSKAVIVDYLLRISELVTQGKELQTAAAAVQKEMKKKQLHDKEMKKKQLHDKQKEYNTTEEKAESEPGSYYTFTTTYNFTR